MSARPALPHVVVIAMFPGVDTLDVTGPAEVFAMAGQFLGNRRAGYEVRLAGERRGPVPTFSGVRICVEEVFAEQPQAVDTLLVPGRMLIGPGGPVPQIDPGVVAWLREAGPRAGRVASVCAGAHITAAAGLLDGHRATTHWATVERLAADHPEIEVESDPIFVRSGRMWTSAGITSSMDLALALVAEDHGDQVALDVARAMVMYLQRPGGQSQFSVPLAQRPGDREDIRGLRLWIGEHLDADLSVPALAARMVMSERHFARVFHAETGSTPGAFVESMRLEAARRMLERTGRPPSDIARACGFRSVETLHRVFRERLGTTPGEYRRRFRATASG
ncbi:AraC family transcriptional regulator [Planobispora rosea]|uniref:AraC family transcriptional regulator n=1 Tax=Planobispora rosea TaxID=35762 RepID=A0A8J3RVA3_PLARO|nr:GlxA family transcriptional regulator [Planobispora rosea]GGS68567.1 AraC family transcriptional regulator [Planobispora rosea]GIH82020.1 AraC family transcriptional regulator [Planobispora rosea]